MVTAKDYGVALENIRTGLAGYAVVSSCVTSTGNGKKIKYQVTIGNAGRDMNGTRKFTATSFETLVRQIEKAYGPMPK